jgi:hypothetical protein
MTAATVKGSSLKKRPKKKGTSQNPLRVDDLGLALVYADGRVKERTGPAAVTTHAQAFGHEADHPQAAHVRYFTIGDKRDWSIVSEDPQALLQGLRWIVEKKHAKPYEYIQITTVDRFGNYRQQRGPLAQVLQRIVESGGAELPIGRNPSTRDAVLLGALILLIILLLPGEAPKKFRKWLWELLKGLLGPLADFVENNFGKFLAFLGALFGIKFIVGRKGTTRKPPSAGDQQKLAAQAVQRRVSTSNPAPTATFEVIDGLVKVAGLPEYPQHCLYGYSTAECVADIERYNQVLAGISGTTVPAPIVQAKDQPPLDVYEIAQALGQQVTYVTVQQNGGRNDFDYLGIPITLSIGQPDEATAAVLGSALGIAESTSGGYLEWFGYIGDVPVAKVKGEGTDLTIVGQAPQVPEEQVPDAQDALKRWASVAHNVWDYEDFQHFIRKYYPYLVPVLLTAAAIPFLGVPLWFLRFAAGATAARAGMGLEYLLMRTYLDNCPRYLCPQWPLNIDWGLY